MLKVRWGDPFCNAVIMLLGNSKAHQIRFPDVGVVTSSRHTIWFLFRVCQEKGIDRSLDFPLIYHDKFSSMSFLLGVDLFKSEEQNKIESWSCFLPNWSPGEVKVGKQDIVVLLPPQFSE